MTSSTHETNESSIKLFLAPMEGVIDFVMRDLLTQQGGVDYCVTEFLRITNRKLPHSVFFKNCPELKMNSHTRFGTPVFIQLLGGQPQPLADNAAQAAELGAYGIDLNFGCPAKTVNRHDGGAALLQFPNRLFDIAKTVRTSVPSITPVSAKIRLGYLDTHLALENVAALAEAGVSFITVHCRTKKQGYMPPVFWDWIPRLQEGVKIPIVVNGDIATMDDFRRCQNLSKANHFMIGRGALKNPYLFKNIKNKTNNTLHKTSWSDIKSLVFYFFSTSKIYVNNSFATSRTKQWLKSLSETYPEALELFQEIKIIKPNNFQEILEKNLVRNRKET